MIKKLLCALALTILICARDGGAHSIRGRDGTDPALSEAPVSSLNTSRNLHHINIFDQAQANQLDSTITARQTSCPNPSTDQLCESGYCFLAQDNSDSTWGTCCPAGYYLWLNTAHWSQQKCCPAGTTSSQCGSGGQSEPPLEPVSCGSGGTRSGWACVYSNQNVNAASRATASRMLATGLVWVWMSNWIYQWFWPSR